MPGSGRVGPASLPSKQTSHLPQSPLSARSSLSLSTKSPPSSPSPHHPLVAINCPDTGRQQTCDLYSRAGNKVSSLEKDWEWEWTTNFPTTTYGYTFATLNYHTLFQPRKEHLTSHSFYDCPQLRQFRYRPPWESTSPSSRETTQRLLASRTIVFQPRHK